MHHFPQTGRYSAISRKAGLHHEKFLLGKTNTLALKVVIFLLPFPGCHMYGLAQWSLGSPVPVVSPPTFLCTPNPLPGGWCEKQKRMTVCKPCSAITETSLHYQPAFSAQIQKHSPIAATVKIINSCPAKTGTYIN